MAAETVLLDLDGTVWDGRGWYAAAIAALSGADGTQVLARLRDGESVVAVARSCAVTNARLAAAAREGGGSITVYNGVVETLDRLRARGTPIGIVSNLSGWLARPLLAATGIGAYAKTTATPRPGVPAKPKPHTIRQALEDMGGNAGEGVWLVGDGRVDACAARAAGVRFAWASYGFEDEAPPGAERVLESFSDVLAL